MKKINHYLRNMSKGCSVGESSVDAFGFPSMHGEGSFVLIYSQKSHCLRYGKT